MKKLLLLIPLVVLLTGCPGKDGIKGAHHRPFYVDSRRVCFTRDKAAVLNRYILAINNTDYTKLLVGNSLQLSYPDTCFTVKLEKAVMYTSSYTLDDKRYFYTFIIDNEGHVWDLGR